MYSPRRQSVKGKRPPTPPTGISDRDSEKTRFAVGHRCRCRFLEFDLRRLASRRRRLEERLLLEPQDGRDQIVRERPDGHVVHLH